MRGPVLADHVTAPLHTSQSASCWRSELPSPECEPDTTADKFPGAQRYTRPADAVTKLRRCHISSRRASAGTFPAAAVVSDNQLLSQVNRLTLHRSETILSAASRFRPR
ncbi:hypothetical protein J6590_033784 [Homalodisca vitripennis]|nr:hypothetical protein J6590_033784 [Homalodisca vitripennis]